MRRKRDLITLLLVDITAINVAWLLYYALRVQSGLFKLTLIPDIWLPAIIMTTYWLCIYWFFGLYRPWYAKSRFDEIALIVKAVVFGVLVLFFIIFYDDVRLNEPPVSRLLIFLYWTIMIVFVSVGRATIRSVRRRMMQAGIGLRNSLIIGSMNQAIDLYSRLKKYPVLGYRIVGFIQTDSTTSTWFTEEKENGMDVKLRDEFLNAIPFLGGVESITNFIREKNIEEILLTLRSSEHELLLDIMGKCSEYKVGMKIVPDLYDIVSGQARTNQIYGIPLIEITPQILQPWQSVGKRVMDIAVSIFVIVVGFPICCIVASLIVIDSRGPVFYRQQRVGKDGRVFRIFKFRSMQSDAESESGPMWAGKDDPRVTRIGRLLRKTHLDEIPQFINVLDGDMSLVGPRPERPFFVDQFIQDIPLYRRRLNVHPGITGWAQVKFKYDESVDDVRTKLRYDLFYIENISLSMDVKILLQTLFNIFAAKGHA